MRPKRDKNIVKICQDKIKDKALTAGLASAIVVDRWDEENELMQDPVLPRSESLNFPL